MLVDSHCHLNMKEFLDDLPSVVRKAKEAGVSIMQTICTKKSDFAAIIEIVEQYPEVYASFGIHPHEVEQDGIVSVEEIVEKVTHPKVIGIGETGLDYYYEHSKRDLQQASFINHIQAASKTHLPVIVHSRNADEDTVEILASEMRSNPFSGLIHCFSSTRYLAEKSLDLGLYISLAGIITFKNAEDIRNTIKYVPIDRILIETDSPFLAPVPMRGKRNEPSFIKYVAMQLAEIKNISFEEVAQISTENFKRLFSMSHLSMQ